MKIYKSAINIVKIGVFESQLFRKIYLAVAGIFLVGFTRFINVYIGIKVFLINYRYLARLMIVNSQPLDNQFLEKIYIRWLHELIRRYVISRNLLYMSYIKTEESKAYNSYFNNLDSSHKLRLRYPRKVDYEQRQGDLMILKKYHPDPVEKGVILLNYTESMAKFVSLFDLEKIAPHYRFVIEPSWWGYQNVNFLFFYGIQTEVIIEAPFQADFDFIQSLDKNFYPIKLGAGDWVNQDLFYSGKSTAKIYDIIMVGHWGPIKRHKILFQALRKLPNYSQIRIALIGYPHENRTKADLYDEAMSFGIENQIDFFENISPVKVAEILRKSKVNILLSQAEGANRGIYEGLCSGNVLILNKNNLGVNRDIINEFTGYFSYDHELPYFIDKAIKEFDRFDTGKWARANTGYKVSSQKLNDFIKSIAKANSEPWTEDLAERKNQPNNMYASDSDRIRLEDEYLRLKNYLLIN